MPSAEDEGLGLGDDSFDEDFELAAADEAVVVGGVLAEGELHLTGAFGGDDFAGGVPDFGFDAAAADGAGHGAVFADEEFGAFVAGDGAVDLNDGGKGAFLAEAAEANDLVKEVHSHNLISAACEYRAHGNAELSKSYAAGAGVSGTGRRVVAFVYRGRSEFVQIDWGSPAVVQFGAGAGASGVRVYDGVVCAGVCVEGAGPGDSGRGEFAALHFDREAAGWPVKLIKNVKHQPIAGSISTPLI